jgi:hypothetical protein
MSEKKDEKAKEKKGLLDKIFPRSECCSDVRIVPKKDLKKKDEAK